MDDKIYRGPGHPVGAHFHSGPKGERGLPGVSPKVDMTYNEDDGTVVFTVSDGYGQREQTVPMAELMDDWMEHDSYEVLKQWMDTHSDAEWWVDENHGLHLSNVPPDADDRIGEFVEDWLDDHPEATTTVQDGSITKAKLDTSLKKAVSRVVDTFEDLYNTTEDEVTVLEDNSYFGSGQTVTFMKSPNELTEQDYLQRANGDYMIPKPRHGAPSSNPPCIEIGEVVASYINQSGLVYGNSKTLFNDETTNQIDCSAFSQAVYQGIRYDNSKYNSNASNKTGRLIGNNIPRNPRSYASVRNGYLSREQAMWFAEQNRLFYIDYDCEHPSSQLQTGDLVFESDPEGTVYEPAQDEYFYIHHVFVVLATYPEQDKIVVAQAGSTNIGHVYTQPQGQSHTRNVCKLSTIEITSANATKYIVFARPEYGIEKAKGQPVLNAANQASVTVSPSSTLKTLATLKLKQSLKRDKMYTLVINGTLPQYSTDKIQVDLWAVATNYSQEMCVMEKMNCGDKIAFSFVPMDDIENLTALTLRAYVFSGLTITDSYTYEVDKISLYEGLLPNAEPNVKWLPNIFTPSSGVTVSTKHIWKNDDGLHMRLTCKLDSATSGNGNVTLGTIDKDWLPQTFGTIERFAYVSADARPLEVTTSGDVKVYYLSGEGAGNTFIDIVI